MWHNTYPTQPYGARGLYIDEPLATTAPADARPHCCYISTVIFYDQTAWERGEVVELDRLEVAWNLLGQRWTDQDIGWAALAPFVLCDGVLYELASAQVLRQDDRWIERWLAWRVPSDDRRLAVMAAEAGTVFAVGARVVTPQGAGKVVRVSAKLKASHLVRLDAGGGEWSYRPEELTAEQKRTTMGALP